MANIVIYGAEISGICAAIKAKGNLLGSNESHNIKIIVTNPSGKVGGLATVGGLNCWDVFNSPSYGHSCQGGTFAYLIKNTLQSYKVLMEGEADYSEEINTSDPNEQSDNYIMSMDLMLEELLKHKQSLPDVFGNITDKTTVEIIRAMDIVDIDFTTVTDDNGESFKTINKLYLRSVYRSEDGYIRWGRKTRAVEGDYFIDASDDGKLTSALTAVTVGRYDWPEATLDECEKTNIPIARQQAATLYFRVKDLAGVTVTVEETDDIPEYTKCSYIPYGGGNTIYEKNNKTFIYNDEHYTDRHMLKMYNFAKNSHELMKNEYWANTLLIFDVDGRAHYRDYTTKYYPKYMLSDSINRDEAWVYGKNIINEPAFIEGLKGFDAFNNIIDDQIVATGGEIVKKDNLPVVAEQLYIRESVHLALDPANIGNGTEMTNYAVLRDETLRAYYNADSVENVTGKINRDTRIGLGSYNIDIHPYKKTNIFNPNGTVNEPPNNNERTLKDKRYFGMVEVAHKLRPDLMNIVVKPNTTGLLGSAMYPSYIPYEALIAKDVTNLLVAGSASGICSFSWGELRVLPNLCVLGDAAGISLAYCIRKGIDDVHDVIHKTNNEYKHLDNVREIQKLTSSNMIYTDSITNSSDIWWSNGCVVNKEDITTLGVNIPHYNPDNFIKPTIE